MGRKRHGTRTYCLSGASWLRDLGHQTQVLVFLSAEFGFESQLRQLLCPRSSYHNCFVLLSDSFNELGLVMYVKEPQTVIVIEVIPQQ